MRWDPPLKEYADIGKLRPATFEADRKEGAERLAFHQELFGGILSVREAGVAFVRCASWTSSSGKGCSGSTTAPWTSPVRAASRPRTPCPRPASIRETLSIARGCPITIVMEDTTSFFGEPERATRWASMARRIAEEAAARG